MKKILLRPSLQKTFYGTKHSSNDPIGHLQTFKMHGVELDANLRLPNPMHPAEGEEENTKAVGAITAIYWKGSDTDPITLVFRLNASNLHNLARPLQGMGYGEILDPNDRSRQTVVNLLKEKVYCEFSFVIFEYDPVEKGYYRSFMNNREGGQTHLDSTLEVRKGGGGEVWGEFQIDRSPSEEVHSPRNYQIKISVIPMADKTQTLNVATGKMQPPYENAWKSE